MFLQINNKKSLSIYEEAMGIYEKIKIKKYIYF